MTATRVQGVVDLTFLDIEDEASLATALGCQNLSNTAVLTETDESNNSNQQNQETKNSSRGESRGGGGNESPSMKRRRETTKGLRLSNNLIRDMDIIVNPVRSSFDPSRLLWLDLSFNKLKNISIQLLTDCVGLTTLYLHANEISKLSQVKKLSVLTSLKSLTLYGNPVEEHKHYKKYILYNNTHLQQFDSSTVTKVDRVQVSLSTASRWNLVIIICILHRWKSGVRHIASFCIQKSRSRVSK